MTLLQKFVLLELIFYSFIFVSWLFLRSYMLFLSIYIFNVLLTFLNFVCSYGC